MRPLKQFENKIRIYGQGDGMSSFGLGGPNTGKKNYNELVKIYDEAWSSPSRSQSPISGRFPYTTQISARRNRSVERSFVSNLTASAGRNLAESGWNGIGFKIVAKVVKVILLKVSLSILIVAGII